MFKPYKEEPPKEAIIEDPLEVEDQEEVLQPECVLRYEDKVLRHVYDGRDAVVPKYKSTANALSTIARSEGIKGLYAGFFPAVLGSSISWGMYFYLYNTAKSWNMGWWTGKEPGAGLHLLSAAEAGALVSLATNPFWLVKTRLQLQSPGHGLHKPYAGFTDAIRSIVKDEGWRAFYKGLGPSLLLVSV
ncbi:hypothetical protein L7F22_015204 [Adiantum nelumboides]|nr:hypothetical protein [Adiantum nelumboides]